MSSIFSTYVMRENRVTDTFTTLLRTLSIDQAQTLLGSLLEDPDLELVKIKNQSGQVESTPDAEISGEFKILIETKVEPDAVNWEQLKRHCEALPDKLVKQGKAALILLTPDAYNPLDKNNGKVNEEVRRLVRRLVKWINFDDIAEATKKLEEDSFLFKKDQYLLMQFRNYLEEEGLLGSLKKDPGNRVVVVPAGLAWEEYQECNAYICQERRTFQPSKRLAFYTKGEIKPQIPKILAVLDSVFFPEKDEQFDPEKHINLPSDKNIWEEFNEKDRQQLKQHLVKVVDYWREKRNEYGRNFKVFLLSPYIKDKIATPGEHNHTWVRSDSIKHNPEGKMTAFVQRQRYVDFDSLKKAKTTATLEDAKGR